MNRLIVIFAALMLGACSAQAVPEEEVDDTSLYGAQYVGLDENGNEQTGSVRKFTHMSFGGPNTNPASTRTGPFPDPWEKRTGPFPDPWQASSEPAPKPGDKP